jgi:large subunit ribosomal protein L22
MEIYALAYGIRTPPRKARLVAATVVGLPVTEALTVLAFTPRAAAVDVAKVIKSAAANAEHNYELNVDDLRVARIEVDGARTIKRFRPRAQGRAFSIFKRTCHMRAVVTDDPLKGREPAEARPRRRRRDEPAAREVSAGGRRRTRATAAAPAVPAATATVEAEVEPVAETPTPRASRAARVQGAKARQARPKAEKEPAAAAAETAADESEIETGEPAATAGSEPMSGATDAAEEATE